MKMNRKDERLLEGVVGVSMCVCCVCLLQLCLGPKPTWEKRHLFLASFNVVRNARRAQRCQHLGVTLCFLTLFSVSPLRE